MKPNVLISITVLSVFLFGCSASPENIWQGYVEGEFVYVASSESGRLEQLLVRRGQQVAARAPLFVLEATRETAAREQALHLLQSSRAQLSDLQTGKRPQEIDVIRARLAQAVADEKKASAQYERDLKQHQAGGIAKAELDTSRAAAESTLARVRELTSEVEVARLSSRSEQIAAQDAQVAAAQAALDQAEWVLQQKSVFSPAASRVFDTLYRQGEWVPAGSPVVRLLPPENVKVRFFVPETIVGKLATGNRIVIECDGCQKSVQGMITYISEQSEYTPPVIYSNENRAKLVFMIEAHPEPDDAALLHPGQPVSVRLQNADPGSPQ